MAPCACGCALPAPLATRTRRERGQVKGRPLKYRRGHQAVTHGLYRGQRGKIGHVLARYGLTPEAHADLLTQQGDACAICRAKRRLVVDHDHETGVVRGLLCYRCNINLEWAEETADARKAYLAAAACRA